VPSIEGLGVHAVQAAHSARQVRLRRFQQDVTVATHQAIRVKQPLLLLDLPAQQLEKALPTRVIDKDVLPPVAPRRNVVHSPKKTPAIAASPWQKSYRPKITKSRTDSQPPRVKT